MYYVLECADVLSSGAVVDVVWHQASNRLFPTQYPVFSNRTLIGITLRALRITVDPAS